MVITLLDAIQKAFEGRAWSFEGLPARKKRRYFRRPQPPCCPWAQQLELELLIPSDEEFLVMTDQEILALREELLVRSLRACVDGRVSRAQKEEWIQWISSNEVAPFSFVVCAIESGVDPLSLRDTFRDFVRRHHKKHAAEIPFAANRH